MTKGEDTRGAILRQALDLTSEVGLVGLTIGELARRAGMSKSGLYAHFESKEDLQSQVLDAAAGYFVDMVIAKALKQPRGLPRVTALFHLWLDWSTRKLSGGCPFIAAATEFDDRAGPVRENLVAHLRDVTETVVRAAQISVEEGHFRRDLDVAQFVFEFWGIILSHHQSSRLMGQEDARARADKAFANLVTAAGGA